MKVTAAHSAPEGPLARAREFATSWSGAVAALTLAAFAVYWISALLLVARAGTTHFGADTWFYTELAKGNVFERIATNFDLARIFRFHPTTAVLGTGWMALLSPLTALVSPPVLLKGLFALIGAIGVWAAVWAFAAVVPRRMALVWGAIYASTMAVWYFSSIEESKIVSATLASLYIAVYMHLRTRWALRGAVILTAILLLACLNEIVAAFLVAIPAVDALVEHGWDLRRSWWIALHALAAPLALAILEVLVNGWLVPVGSHPEGATHVSMLWWYIAQSDFNYYTVRAFFVRWLFFNIAAPERFALHWANPSIGFGGDFVPILSSYFSSPLRIALVAVFVVMLVAVLLPRYRTHGAVRPLAGLLLGLLAYDIARAGFFFIFNAKECLLFSSSVTLAHLLLLGIPFMASKFPYKPAVLLSAAALLFVTNGLFIIG